MRMYIRRAIAVGLRLRPMGCGATRRSPWVSAPSFSDELILELFGRSDPQRIALLYDQYQRLAYALALRVVHDVTAAEDVQEAFMAVWRHRSTFQPDRGSLRTWLCAIVHNRALDRLRGPSGRTRFEHSIDGTFPAKESRGNTPFTDPWEQVVRSLGARPARSSLGGVARRATGGIRDGIFRRVLANGDQFCSQCSAGDDQRPYARRSQEAPRDA